MSDSMAVDGRAVPSLETIRIPVVGMTCGSCVSRITRAIRALDGVTRVSVDLRRETATVTREPALVSNAALAVAVAAAGYAADLDAATVMSDVEPARRWPGLGRAIAIPFGLLRRRG